MDKFNTSIVTLEGNWNLMSGCIFFGEKVLSVQWILSMVAPETCLSVAENEADFMAAHTQ